MRDACLEALKALLLATQGGVQLTAPTRQVLLEHLRSVQSSDKSPAVRARATALLSAVETPATTAMTEN